MVFMQAERLFKGDKNGLRLLGVAVQPERRDNFLLARDATQGACYVRFGLHEMMQLALPIHAHLPTGGSAIGLSATGAPVGHPQPVMDASCTFADAIAIFINDVGLQFNSACESSRSIRSIARSSIGFSRSGTSRY
jgi:hypothetical protein